MPQIQEHRQVQDAVRAHAGWVYSCARRRVRDEALAEDVAQAVFILFWQKHAKLAGEAKLTGWLYRAVRYCSANALRRKQIRQRHEKEAAMAGLQDVAGGVRWDEISPELEQAVDRLRDKYRAAVLLRFYRQMSFTEVGQSLGISEEAARKRVDRALESLRGLLAKKGVVAGAAGLGVMLAANVTGAAPAGVVERIAAGTAGTNSAGAIAKGAAKMMVWAKVKLAAVIVLAAGAGAVVAGEAVMPKSKPPSSAPVVVQRANPETRHLAAKLAEEMEAQMGKTNRVSYTFKMQHGTATDADMRSERMGPANSEFAPKAGEFGWDKATTQEYGKVTMFPDDPARRNVEEFGGRKGRWTAVRQMGPGSTDRWAKVTPRRPNGMPDVPAGYIRFDESTVPDMIRAAQDIQISQELLNGERCYRVVMVTQVRRAIGPEEDAKLANSIEPHCLWLSIEHGLLPVRCERYYIDNPPPGGQPWTASHFVRPEYLSDVVIQRELKQMPNGVWFPAEVLTYTFVRDAKGQNIKWSARITLSDVAVNEAATVTTLVIPPAAMKGPLKDMVRDWTK